VASIAVGRYMPDKLIRVFLVDDSDAFRRSAGRYLSQLRSCELVGMASSGTEALARVAALQPDLVLLDIVMPGMDGFEVARRLKSQPSAPHVVMVTIHDDASYRVAAREAGADGFISKTDFTLQVLTLLHEMAERMNADGTELT
jgi:two-component system nitrate/nitrite response regulator NarL